MAYLNFTTGLPIAKVMSGNLAGDTIYLFDPDFDKVHPTRGKRFNKVAMPDDDKRYQWDEATTSWKEIE